MNFFKSLFASSEENPKENFPWKTLETTEDLEQLIATSKEKAVLIFKHSTRCAISSFSLRGFETDFPKDTQVELYLLDLLRFRALSQQIAERFDVVHQSPQVLLIRDGKVVYHESHGQISAAEITKVLQG